MARRNHSTSPKPQFTASYWVSHTSSVMRAKARASGVRGNSGGSGQRSSMYSKMTVDSKMRVGPSTSTGTSARGLAATNGPSVRPVPKLSGTSTSKVTPFSRSAILTFWA